MSVVNYGRPIMNKILLFLWGNEWNIIAIRKTNVIAPQKTAHMSDPAL